MKLKSIISILIISLLYSCSTRKVAANQATLVNDISAYTNTIDNNSHLKKEVTEGALTDIDGFKDIGTFKYTIYFDDSTKELYKIVNVEKTNKNATETYYFKKRKLVSIISVSGDGTKKIFLKKERVIAEENTSSEDQQLLIAKARRFQKAFKSNH